MLKRILSLLIVLLLCFSVFAGCKRHDNSMCEHNWELISQSNYEYKCSKCKADWGNEYYFQGKTEAIMAPGTYYCSFRIRFAGKDYVYADLNGLWDGTSALSKTFTVSE